MKNIPERSIKRGLELGVNFYDTAIAYQSGTSEQYVGRALREILQSVKLWLLLQSSFRERRTRLKRVSADSSTLKT
ncbi:MAG: aldo/keto reductase [Stomatobaculum sp.]